MSTTKVISMKAITQPRYGDSTVLEHETVSPPRPGPNEVLVRVRAASLNPADVFRMRGRPRVLRLMFGLTRPKQAVVGSDGAGIVEAVGDEVTEWSVGDEVFGEFRGSLAEYAVAPADRIGRVPQGVTFEHAAASVMAGLAAMHGLRAGGLAEGQRVLIIAASGGIGSFSVQLAKAAGAHVTAVCSSRNVEPVCALGADAVIDYTREDLLATPERFDLIFDNVGATPMLDLLKLTTPTGLVLPNSGLDGPDGGALMRVIKAGWHGKVRRRRIGSFYSQPTPEDMAALAGMLADGTVKPWIGNLYSLTHGADAMAEVASGHARGKVAITIP